MTGGVVHWEIAGRDLDSLTDFYRELFGWEPERNDENYRVIATQDGLSGGLMHARGQIPPYVTVYVAVADLDATLRRVEQLHGTRLVPPTPIPGVGTFAMFQDPEGNTIGIVQSAD